MTTHPRHQKTSYATGTNISEEHTASTFGVEERNMFLQKLLGYRVPSLLSQKSLTNNKGVHN